MSGLRHDPDDYALLDRMRRRRREPDPRTMRFIADIQEVLEGIADQIGLDLTLEVMAKKGYDYTLTYWGVEFFLYANEIALKAISLLRTGDDRGLRQDEGMLHASVHARRTLLPTLGQLQVTKVLGEEKGKAAWARMAPGLHTVKDIVDLMWAQVKPLLADAHRRGARPAQVWEQT